MGRLYLSAIVQNNVMKVDIQITNSLLLILLDTCSELELLDHTVILVLIFEELQYCFPWRLYHFTLLTTVHKGSDYFTSSTNTCFCQFSFILATLVNVQC